MRLRLERSRIRSVHDGLRPSPGSRSQCIGLARITLRPCANGSEIKLGFKGLRGRAPEGCKAYKKRKYRKGVGLSHSAQQFRLRQTR
jgi:hypothetical protein